MLDFSSKIRMYEWFQQIQGWNRMDFLCNLIHLCNPFELRFLGSCIEDMAQMDYNCLRDQEIKTNSVENLDQFISKCPPVDEFRSHISVCLALLQSSNYKVARRLAELLDDKLEGLNLEHLMQAGLDAEVEQWMLMLTLASYHPAFSFEKKLNFKRKLADYERLNKRERKSSRCWSRSHRCSQQQHSLTKYQECDESNWRTEFNPPIPPFQHYPMYEYSYAHSNYLPDPCAEKPQVRGDLPVPDNFARPTNFMPRPSNFPNALMPASGMGDTNFFEKQSQDYRQLPSNFAQNVDFLSPGYSTKLREDQKSMLSVVLPPHTTTLYTDPLFMGSCQSPPHVLPSTVASNVKHDIVSYPTLSDAHTTSYCFCSANSVSTIATTAVAHSTIQQSSIQSVEYLSSSKSNGDSSSSNENQFIPISSSQSNDIDSETIINRIVYETEKSEYTDDFNDIMQKDDNLGVAKKQIISNKSCNVRTSVSMPTLTHVDVSSSIPLSGSEHGYPNLRNINSLQSSSSSKAANLTPLKVSVRKCQRNKKDEDRSKNVNFKLKVEWSDGATSECEKTVDEMMKFFNQMSGKLKKSALNTDFRFQMKQQNQVEEKREKLEAIFREILWLSTSSSSHENIVSFFKSSNNFTKNVISNLPFKKRKQGLKYRYGAECSNSDSSSSSTSSSPLNANNSRLPASKNDAKYNSTHAALSSADTESATALTISTPAQNITIHIDDETREKDELASGSGTNFCELEKPQSHSIELPEHLTNEEKIIPDEDVEKLSSKPMQGSVKPLELGLRKLNLTTSRSCNAISTGSFSDDGKTLDVKSLPDDISRSRSEDEKSGTSQTVPFEIPDSSSDSIQAVASNSCFSFEFDSSTATVETSDRFSKPSSQKSSENEMELPSDKDLNLPFRNTKFFYTQNSSHSPGKAWSQTDIAPSREFSQTVPAYYFPSKSAPPFHPMPYYTQVHHDSIQGSQVVQMLGCYHPQVLHSNTTPISVTSPLFTQVATSTLPSPIAGQKPPQYTYTVPSNYDPPLQNISYIPAEKVVVSRVGMGQAACYYNQPPPKMQPRAQNAYPPMQIQHNTVRVTYSDPSSFTAKHLNSVPNDFNVYHPNQDLNLPGPGAGLINGYPETRKPLMGPPEHPQMLNRNQSSVQNLGGDMSVKPQAMSCYNCGREGHDAGLCVEPNAVDVLGSDFHLKMSQLNNRKAND